MSEFEAKLSAMVSKELTGDPEQIGTLIERLTNALGLAVAVSSRGDHQAASNLLKGVDIYLTESVAEHSKLARFLNTMRSAKQ